ncbi:Gamma-tubulin complex component protein [Kalmanozyma brasiliensis GHG001]|uniref:Gamma-tubulin complex component protein n=1 Tax=Kalmanozyma brasiliensis (strain GHG001) TaxID=1365824 RepID=UPI002867FC7C|nr:Gamma-tubulin complex component protein [Kalmanozyma brasiliensis GHG001]EST04955.2 Gamma-tubulin complex component protein [Kalmanozyma brasiliensis GHG001]
MTPVAGSSSSGLLPGAVRSGSTRTASRSKTNKRIDQERIVDHLLAVFLDSQDAPSTPSSSSRASQKAKAINFVEKDSWSPADDDEIAAALQGLSLKHSIHLDYELATALKRCYSQLLVSCERSVRLTDQARESEKRRGSANARNLPDPLVRPDNVADAVRFLLQLSKPADVTARTTANLMLNATQSNRAQYLTPEQRRQAEKREWLGILVDEPLEGDVWADDDVDQDTSDLSDWSLDSDDEKRLRIGEGYDSDKEIRKRRDRLTAISDSIRPSASSTQDYAQREQWSRAHQHRQQALRAAGSGTPANLSESDVVRESVSALLGCTCALFPPQQSVPSGLSEQLGAITSIASTLTSLRRFVGGAISQGIQAVNALTRTPAVEAFAEQLRILLERLHSRLSEMDADIAAASMSLQPINIRTDRYATMTQLLEFLHREAASVLLLARLLEELGFISNRKAAPDTFAAHVSSDRALIDGLQALLGFVHQQDEVAYCDDVLADLSTCLLAACRPAWRSVCRLLQRGLSFAVNRADDLLFKDRLVQHMIKHDASLSTSDSTFWTSGYNAKHSRGHATLDDVVDQGYSPPAFLQSIVQDVVTTAKGVGLLRSLGIDALGEVQPDGDLDRILGLRSLVPASVLQQGRGRHQEGDVEHALTGGNASVKHAAATPEAAKATLRRLLFPKSAQGAESKPLEETLPQTPLSQPDSEPSWQLGSANRRSRTSNRLLEPMLGQALQEHLSPISAIVRKRLFEVLSSPVTDGGYALQTHLRACHGLFLMQEGAEMTSWFDSLFRDLDRPNGTIRAVHQHRLNSTFIDVLEAHEPGRAGQVWIDANLVRFFTGDDDADSAAAIRQRTRIRRLADVQVEYEVPWPLTFAFPTACMRFYQTMFTTLLQARYAQWKLSATLKLAKPETMHMRKFWALRRQAQWLVRTLIAFLQSDVLLDGSERLCAALEGATSLDSAIQIHTEALERMEKLCFHRIEQVKVKELFGAAWRIGAEVVNNYERFIGTSSQGEDRLARRKRRERRKKQRDRAKREGAPLGAIVEEDEEEEEEDAEDDQNEADYGELLRDYDGPAQPGAYDVYSDDVTLARSDAFGSTSVDASMSVDTSASWLDSETNKRERFRVECERQRKALLRLVEELKVNVDDQIGRIAARAAAQAQDATLADRALQEHDYARAKWQGLLDALAWSDLSY